MPFNPKTLRKWFAFSAIALFAVVLGFFFYAKYRVNKAISEIPKKLGADIQQSAKGFSYTQSAGGRTLYSISAKNAVQYKGSQHAALNDVRIIVFGRGQGTQQTQGSTYDQIYGRQFDYDAASGEVKALGDVIIDLEAKGKPGENPADGGATTAAIHLKTSGLTFNQKTGVAQTAEKIEFALPQARGSAIGGVYDSKEMTLRLKSNVNVQTSQAANGKARSATKFGPANITASDALIQDSPRQAILNSVHMVGSGDDSQQMEAGRVTISLRDDNTVENILATGGVTATANSKKTTGTTTRVRSTDARFSFNDDNDVKTAVLTGAVNFEATGASPLQGNAGHVVIDFAGKNQIAKVHASDNVRFQQGKAANAKAGTQNQDLQIKADAMDFFMKPNNQLDRAVTSGASEIVMNSDPTASPAKAKSAGSRTVITASRFEAGFSGKNRIQSLHGTGDAKIVSSSPGLPDRISASREIYAQFDPARSGGISSVTQEGDLKYSEGQRTASADRAKYIAADDTLVLTGNVRVQDAASGLTLTANSGTMNRRTGEYVANGEVKTTFNQIKPNPNGAILASPGGDPIHVTAQAMTATRNADTAKYTGDARLWQGANLIQAPVIVFDRAKRGLTASAGSDPAGKAPAVETVFVQTDKSGKTTPLGVKAAKLTYSDNERHARFEGGVSIKTSDTVLTGDHVDILLRPKNAKASAVQESPSQVDQIIAERNIVIEQQNPTRKATGQKLVYTAADSKFVLTGEPGKPPSIFDAERGNVSGDSLTFYNRDDRVQVGSGQSSRTVTRTRIKDESKP